MEKRLWWRDNNLRLIQTNLRITDAKKNIVEMVDRYESLNANAVLINTAGIVSFYPSELECEYVNPFLNGFDFLGELMDECHRRGLRVINRFDFSKIHESIYRLHPRWAYIGENGNRITYNGLISTCVNGEYQKEKSLEIIDEVLSRYDSDGVFFNMFGYVTRDYSNNYYGICHCDSCRKAFMDFSGFSLPPEDCDDDEVLTAYRIFQKETVKDRLRTIYEAVKKHGEHIAVCNYADDYVDIVMSESNTEVTRPYPIWDYMTSENVMKVYGGLGGKTSGDISINASSLDYRFHGISTPLLKHRFYEALAAGGQLLWCIIGTFDDYPDRKNLSVVADIFGLHKSFERYFGNRRILGNIVLVYPEDGNTEAIKEFRGIFRSLKEEHMLFSVVGDGHLKMEHLIGKDLCIVPDSVEPVLPKILSKADVKVLWTGARWKKSGLDLTCLFPDSDEGNSCDVKWHYADMSSGWAFLMGDAVCFPERVETDLEMLSAGIFGPPELCGGNNPTGRKLVLRSEQGTLLAFYPGKLYYSYGFFEHKSIFIKELEHFVSENLITTDAPSSVEVSVCEGPDFISIYCISHAGFNGTSFSDPAVIREFEIRITCDERFRNLCSVLKYDSDVSVAFEREENEAIVKIRDFKDFVMVNIGEKA